MLSRRRLIVLGGLAGGAALAPVTRGLLGEPEQQAQAQNMMRMHDHGGRVPAVRTGAGVAPFSVAMPLPPVLAPVATLPGIDFYRLSIQPSTTEILPGVSTPVLTYGGQFTAPTIRVRQGRRALVTFDNKLGHEANVHLHGGRVPAASDGYPMDLIANGKSKTYDYPNNQAGATLWYHDHTHHMEAEHVYRGMHGFYLVEGTDEQQLGLPSGAYDVPILLRDVLFDDQGGLVFDPADPYNRPTLMANGKSQPYFKVAARKYRLRLLNGSAHRIFELSLGNGAQMTQIATDCGLLPAPVPTSKLVLSSGERAEVVIDFGAYPLGTQVTLEDVSGPVLRFDVERRALDRSRVPDRLRAKVPLAAATQTRQLTLSLDPVNIQALINNQAFDPNRVDMQVRRGSSEIWEVTNSDTNVGGSGFGVPHNFHTHLAQFRILDRDGKAPLPGEAGWKDTVLIQPGETVRFQANFADYLGRYVYHCHMLEHSAIGMMGQMEIVS
ncbi:bilirubin oxidase [Nonomuraea sp. WAC 01424]|nr:bilirubin oxidase [Nonomuraea sp. WAC 01424]